MVTRTLALVKPDAMRRLTEILTIVHFEHFEIVDIKKMQWWATDAAHFHKEHATKSFFNDLIRHMTGAPLVAMILGKDGDAVKEWRKLIGATNPSEASPGSIRARFWNGKPMPQNVVHGSDSTEAADREIQLLFKNSRFL